MIKKIIPINKYKNILNQKDLECTFLRECPEHYEDLLLLIYNKPSASIFLVPKKDNQYIQHGTNFMCIVDINDNKLSDDETKSLLVISSE